MQKRILLLGGLTIMKDGQPIPKLISRKADALLAYLAHEQRPYSRESLATLLWDDRSQKQALSNLRTLLSSLRKHAADFVTITRQTAVINDDVWVDTAVFQQQIANAQLEDALELYQGDFLDGVLLRDSLELEDWIQYQREQLRQQVIGAYSQRIAACLQQAAYHDGIHYATRLLEMDPWNEETHRQMMTLLARSGQRGAAIEQYETCRRMLDEELSVEPDDETAALLRRIESADNNLTVNLPAPLTTFVGRAQERLQISECLRDGQTRLLTLIGLGGIGKTRLAIQIAHDMANHYLNGVYFVPLAPLESADFLLSTIATAVHLDFAGQGDPKKQLFNHLREKEALLVLDNFEHLLAGARLLDELLQNAPNITLLVTSRERLQLRAEHLFEIGGLSCPSRADTAAPTAHPPMTTYDSLHLFRERARLVDINFGLTAENYDCVTQICLLLQGMPLGIELAAAWIRVFSCSQILAQIEQNIDFLATQMRDVPERHRSLRAVFDYVWELLSPEERSLFVNLSLFRGGFTIEAATAVADVSSWTIAALVEKSLLRKQENGRYEMLEVMRRFATALGTEYKEQIADGRANHARYFADFMAERDTLLNAHRTKETQRAITVELENVHAAWSYAIAHTDVEIATAILPALADYYVQKGPFQEGLGLVETAVDRFTAVSTASPHPTAAQANLLSQLHAAQANLHDITANFDAAIAAAKQMLRWGEIGQNIKNQANGHRRLGWNYANRGDYDEAITHIQKGLELAKTLPDKNEEASCARAASIVWVRLGRYARGAESAKHACTLFRQTGNRWGEARSLNMLGIAYWYLHDYDKCKAYYQQALPIYQEVGNVDGHNTVLGNLGLVAALQRDYDEADRLYRQALQTYQRMGNRGNESWMLNNLGELAIERLQFEKALDYCREAARLAAKTGGRLVESEALQNIGRVYWWLGEYAHAATHYQQSAAIWDDSGTQEAYSKAVSFNDRSWLALDQGKIEAALTYAQQALALGDESEDMRMQAAALTALGNALVAAGNWTKAETAYRRALPLWDSVQRPQRAIDSQAGLAGAALAQGNVAAALAVTDMILAWFATHSIYGILSPFGAYFVCVQALQAANDPRAKEVLAEAKSVLAETAVSIQNASLRRSYLQNVPAHRLLQAM